jgi:hypothetical protein
MAPSQWSHDALIHVELLHIANPQRALNTVRWAMSPEVTPEISITFRKTRAEVAEISLRRVMHPLLFPTASTV